MPLFQLVDGHAAVTSPGTPVALATAIAPLAIELLVSPIPGNTGNVYVGGPGVLAATPAGTLLRKTDPPLVLKNVNPNTVFIDAANANDGVSFTSITQATINS